MGGCACTRSVAETKLDEFWSSLKFRKEMTAESYVKAVEALFTGKEDEIKKRFVVNDLNDKQKDKDAESLYESHKTKNYFFLSLFYLLKSNKAEDFKHFQTLTRVLGIDVINNNITEGTVLVALFTGMY